MRGQGWGNAQAMRTLAIECATEMCSLALYDGRALLGWHHEVLGRGHAEHLVPLIGSLPGKGRADRILLSLGPGSFTGVRIGLAAARALGLAWGAQVGGFPTLALVAATAQACVPGAVSVCMSGGHGEWFVQNFSANLVPDGDVCSVTPEASAGRWNLPTIAGNRAAEKAALEASGHNALVMLPDARNVLAIPEALLRDELAPIYGRGPDARLPS